MIHLWWNETSTNNNSYSFNSLSLHEIHVFSSIQLKLNNKTEVFLITDIFSLEWYRQNIRHTRRNSGLLKTRSDGTLKISRIQVGLHKFPNVSRHLEFWYSVRIKNSWIFDHRLIASHYIENIAQFNSCIFSKYGCCRWNISLLWGYRIRYGVISHPKMAKMIVKYLIS